MSCRLLQQYLSQTRVGLSHSENQRRDVVVASYRSLIAISVTAMLEKMKRTVAFAVVLQQRHRPGLDDEGRERLRRHEMASHEEVDWELGRIPCLNKNNDPQLRQKSNNISPLPIRGAPRTLWFVASSA